MRRLRLLLPVCALLILPLSATPTSLAQNDDRADDADRGAEEATNDEAAAEEATNDEADESPRRGATEPKAYPPYRRVPRYFGQIGLSPQQKADIYSLRGRYQFEIDELERRVEELKQQEMAECESILTDAQKKLLGHLREAPRSPYAANTNPN